MGMIHRSQLTGLVGKIRLHGKTGVGDDRGYED